jgi:hypothetical protein
MPDDEAAAALQAKARSRHRQAHGDGRREHDGLRAGPQLALAGRSDGSGEVGENCRAIWTKLSESSPRHASKTTEGPELPKMRTATRFPPASTDRETRSLRRTSHVTAGQHSHLAVDQAGAYLGAQRWRF